MSDLIRIVYVSRSTAAPRAPGLGLEPGVARILAQSRRNNARRGLVGALYFGDGCFFQCLEGPAAEVDRLLATLRQDPRHADLTVLARAPIARTGFAAWSMKYVPADAAMRALLRERGLDHFDPYRFDAATVDAVLALLRDRPGDEPAPAMNAPGAPDPLARRALHTARWALATAAAALLVAAAAALAG